MFNQFVWLFDTSVPVHRLEELRAKLAEGLLSRRVVTPALPTARHSWVRSTVSLPLDLTHESIAPESVRGWAEDRITDEIDPETGLGWQLSAAPLKGGGTVVSLVCSHMVADGAAMVAAVRLAAGHEVTTTAASADLGERPSLVQGIADDVVDTLGQLKPIASWGVRALVETVGRASNGSEAASAPKPKPRRAEVAENTSSWSPPYVVVECESARWREVAAEWGGTSSSLFVAVLTAVSEAAGRARPGDDLTWSLPVNDRALDSLDSNSTKIVAVRAPVPDRDDLDLTRIRKASKAAFTEFAARQGSGSDRAVPLQLIQMLPDAVVAKLPRPADGAEGLCSNLGSLPDDFLTIGGVRARSVAARATFAGADAEFARSLGGGLTAWATETEDCVTVTAHGMDPDRTRSDEELRDLISGVLDRWGLTYRFW